MKIAIEKFIENSKNGLFLLDSPTGFGKTHAVKQILKDFLSGKKHQDIERMFFITNLKTNLPDEELAEELTEEEKLECVRIRALEEDVIANWGSVYIYQDDIKKSKEFKALNSDIEIRNELLREKVELEKDKKSTARKQRSIDSFDRKIATITEPAFREYIKKNYFYGRSVVDKKKFVAENEWLKKLYPICEIEKKKVVFMTTAKFFSPINIFYRMPFFIYNDSIIDNSVIFIDEFDTTKETVLNQITENSLKIRVDIISLFTNIYYVLNGLSFPAKLLRMSDKNIEEEESVGHLLTSQDIIDKNKKRFEELYKRHNFDLLLKSSGFVNRNAFIFDDGNYITVYNDSSKLHFSVREEREGEVINKLTAESYYNENYSLNTMLFDVQYAINYFAKGVEFLSNNYYHAINTDKEGRFIYKYTKDEALMTILSAFNLNGDNKDYLWEILTDGRYKIETNNVITRKGFKFLEIEDSNYHDLQSVAHKFNFETIPENLVVLIAESARLVGISATATIPTVIGNYDLEYIKTLLKEKNVEIADEDRKRIAKAFLERQKYYDGVKINVKLIDDLNCFSDLEKSKILLSEIFNGEYLEKYLKIAESDRLNAYYFLMQVKLAYLYKEVGIKNIYSFIVFQNRLPKPGDADLDSEKLNEIFEDVADCNGFSKYSHYNIQSETFDDEMDKVYEELKEGNKCFVISTYKTVGSGKNIQYPIPSTLIDNMLIFDEKKLEKDFDGMYLMTPTNLTQRLYYDSDDKYRDLSKYLYQQQSLFLNDKLTNGQYRQNIISGFRHIFFGDRYSPYYNKNSDLCCHTTQLAIQAVGRICRCVNKNKNIYIYADIELAERIQRIRDSLSERLFNKEFLELLQMQIVTKKISTVQDYSRKSKLAFIKIRNNAYTVRSSKVKVEEWKRLRDYVLQNPTADFIQDKYEELYFKFDTKQNGYAYKQNNRFDITEMLLDTREDMQQVSAQECELPIMLSIPCVNELFQANGYKGIWRRGLYVMSPSLFMQVYKGALGEVVGKTILEKYIGWNLEEISDYTLYELFDFKIKNVYIDIKHWNTFQADPEKQMQKIKRKLDRTKGERAIIINIMKRGNHVEKESRDGDIITIPYLIDPKTNEVSCKMIEKIEEAIIT